MCKNLNAEFREEVHISERERVPSAPVKQSQGTKITQTQQITDRRKTGWLLYVPPWPRSLTRVNLEQPVSGQNGT